MRVLLISHTCQSRTEGQPKAHQLGQLEGVELCVLAPSLWKHYGQWRHADPAISDSFQLITQKPRFPWAGPAQFYLHYYPQIVRLIRDFRPDIIDLWEEPWGLVSYHTIRVARRVAPNALIVSETEQNIDKTLPYPFEMFRRYTLKHADFLVGRSREAVAVAKSKGYTGPSAVVPNAVDETLFRPMDRFACRSAFGVLERDTFVAGYVGRLVPEKGIDDLIMAIKHVPGARLLIAGDGPQRSDLESLCQTLGLGDDRVRFVGSIAPPRLPQLINALDVLVLPSRTTARWKEQFGRVIIEAHACGVPVIGSDSGAIPDVVADGGLIYPEGDAATLAARLQCLADEPALRHHLGETGRRIALETRTWSAVARQMHGIYRDLLAPAAHIAANPGAGRAAVMTTN
jgi:glycosyltransferase involved in cell wall biosynthesis